jgi:poly(3-hydroxybutyrate) depolymerase
MRSRQALLAAWLLAVGSACASGKTVPGSPASPSSGPGPGIHEQTLSLPGGQTLRYTLAIPDGYRDDRPAPLIVALHFGGRVTPFYGRGMLEVLVLPALAELEAIAVAPDALDRGWDDALDEGSVLALMDHLGKTLAIDRKRVLCTGYSMGGVGTWYLAGRHPDRFTAAIPIAGRPPADLDVKVPVYALHGRDDEVMPIGPTESLINHLSAGGADARLMVVNDATHYQTDRFVDPLRVAAGRWLRRVWKLPMAATEQGPEF